MEETKEQTAAILFCDLKNYSKIETDALKGRALSVLYAARDKLLPSCNHFYSDRWGDCLIICGTNTAEMTHLALGLRDEVRLTDWLTEGFSENHSLRVALHLQKITLVTADGVTQNVVGKGVDTAARIEPIVDPNSVFCTSAFYEDLFFEESPRRELANIKAVNLGARPLAKKYGEMVLYRLDWKRKNQESLQVDQDKFEPIELRTVQHGDDAYFLPDEYRDKVLIHTIHAGNIVPAWCIDALSKSGIEEERVNQAVEKAFTAERDWGANQIAEALASKLGVSGYHCVNVARVLLDFGRFPGETPADVEHLYRFAINYPFSKYTAYTKKKRLLEDYYDYISDYFEERVQGKVLVLGVHTYDQYNAAGTPRSMASLLFRSIGYQEKSRMPFGVFDAMFPDTLGEFTADRKLTARISLELETAGITVSHNHPYSLPEGSFEVRTQVHTFFRHILKEYRESERFGEDDDFVAAFQMVENMLLDTNLRYPHTENLRNYLHLFRKAPEGQEERYALCRTVYEDIQSFLAENDRGAPVETEEDWKRLQEYRYSSARTNSLAIEVRKDVAWQFNDLKGLNPVQDKSGVKPLAIDRVSGRLAEAIKSYFSIDKPEHESRMKRRSLALNKVI